MSKEIFNLGEVQLEAIINGTGETILLLAGGGQDASSFDNFTPLLNKAGYKTVAINRRGFAGSKGPLEDLTLHDLANDIAGVIRKLGEIPVHVLGWAFGNRIARCLAEDHRDLVKTVILLAAGGQIPPEPETLEKISILGNPNSSREEILEALRYWLFSPLTDIETVDQVFKGRKRWPEAQQSHEKASRATPLDDWWNGGEASMLVIQGLDDKSAVPENGEILKRENPERVKLVNLENVGHFMIYEQPQRVVDEIILFLSNFK
ncbi:MAG: alpha/beta fold hydrolase [Promethearchaeota archaeon]|jgi:pimeloyl-ACP methyl ester carboxylesterase